MTEQSNTNNTINTNVLIIEGNLVRDAELRTTNSGKSVCDNTIACNNGQWAGVFVKFSLWENRAERMAQWLTKGKHVILTGRLLPAEAYLDKDGNARAQLVMQVDQVRFLGGPRASENAGIAPAPAPMEEDIPFS